MPLVSVVIPIFRYAKEQAVAIDSVLNQSFSDFEVILVDNNATSEAHAVAQTYTNNHPKRVRLVHEPKQGAASARNCGIMASNAEFVAFLDSDDLMAPTRLAHQVASLQSDSRAVLAHHPVAYSNNEGSIIVEGCRHPKVPEWSNVLTSPFPNPFLPTILVRRNAAIESGLFDERFDPFWLEDLDFSFRVFMVGAFAYQNKPLTIVRPHNNKEQQWREATDYSWHSIKNAALFFEKLRDLHYVPTDRANRRNFLRAQAHWIRGNAKPLFSTERTVEYGRIMYSRALRADSADMRNWKQFMRSRLPYPACARSLKVSPAITEAPDWLNDGFIKNAFSL